MKEITSHKFINEYESSTLSNNSLIDLNHHTSSNASGNQQIISTSNFCNISDYKLQNNKKLFIKTVENNQSELDYNDYRLNSTSNEKIRATARKSSFHSMKSLRIQLGNLNCLNSTNNISKIAALNYKILTDFSKALSLNFESNLSPLISNYLDELASIYEENHCEEAEHVKKIFSFRKDHTNSNNCNKTKSPLAQNELRQSLETMYNLKINSVPKDSLIDLLSQNNEETNNGEIKYLRVEDIIKTKGNSIYGPRREDIGRYNRKLFEIQSRELEQNQRFDLFLNPLFFYETKEIALRYDVKRCDEILASFYSHGEPVKIGKFLIIIFFNGEELFCTIKNANSTLFENLTSKDFEGVFLSSKNAINFLLFETFLMYKIEFKSHSSALSTFDLFFNNDKP